MQQKEFSPKATVWNIICIWNTHMNTVRTIIDKFWRIPQTECTNSTNEPGAIQNLEEA